MTVDLSNAPGVTPLSSGKVRELWLVGDAVLLVASDRISAFDVVLPTAIPDKGKVLTGLTDFWLDLLFAEGHDLPVAHHRITTDARQFPLELAPYADELSARAMLCRRAEVVPVECVARGYLAGSGWKEYQLSQTVCGIELPSGLDESEELVEPIFTPTTKATTGHDEAMTFDEVVALVGGDTAEALRDATLALYSRARAHARDRGILLADTKFEFGFVDGELTLIDEVLTPDSSRFWPADDYAPGRSQPSFDKQYVRDWLADQDWDREPPGPELPDEIVTRTRERYVTAYERLSGRSFAEWDR